MSNLTERLEWLEKCKQFHGHLCMGQALGARIGIKGMELISPYTPREVVVFVECDRCAADAVLTVSGTRLGRRTLKLRDYGRMAATFWNLETNIAWRVNSAYQGQRIEEEDTLRALMELPDEALVRWRQVRVSLPEMDMPGRPRRIVTCAACGEQVYDAKEIQTPDGPLCRGCAHPAYYQEVA